MRYDVRVADRVVRIERALDGRFLVDERVLAVAAIEAPRRQWSVTIEGRAHDVTLLSETPLRLLVDGREVAVRVADERELAAGAARGGIAAGRREVRAPMPGFLKAVHVGEGDIVEAGAPLVTLEAMKMENELRAPARGRVASVAAQAGTKVEGGALLVVLGEAG